LNTGFYRLFDTKGGVIYSTGSYDAEEKKYGHTEKELETGSDRILLHIAGDDEVIRGLALLTGLSSESSISSHKRKVTFDGLFSNLIQNGIRMEEEALKELRIKPDSRWLVITVAYGKEPEENIKGILRDSLPKRSAIAVYRGKEGSTMLLAEIPVGVDGREMVQYTEGLYNMLETEFGEKVNIGVSSPFTGLSDVRKAAEDSRKAACFGKLLSGRDGVHIYEKLGLAKVAANLSPETKDRLFSELIKDSGVDLLDSELIKTIRIYFQNNMNISETARNLYIHRNTLNYRIDKVMKLTGLDLAGFDDAAYLRMILILKMSIGEEEK